LDWNPSSGALGYNVKRSQIKGGPYTTIANVTGTNYVDTGVVSSVVYYYAISATNTFGESAYDSPEASASAGLPTPWQSVDVGTPYLPGSADFAGGVFSVTGNGIDIGGTSDSFQYVYEPMTNNDGSFIARLATMDSVPAAEKVGVMFRASTNANAMAAFLMYDTSSGFGNLRFACRTGTGSGMSYNWEGPYIAGAPIWLKLQRSSATTYTAYYSNDGAAWSAIGTNTFSMTGTVLAGMVECVRFFANGYGTATFDNVMLPSWPPPVPLAPTNFIAVPGDAQASLKWNASSNAMSYNVKRSLTSGVGYVTVLNVTGTNTVNIGLSNGTNYYYVVSALNAGGEGVNSAETSARPVSLSSPPLQMAMNGTSLQFNWPADHLGWRLVSQTNSANVGLTTNWTMVGNSSATNQLSIPIGANNGSVFFRLVYP
jgi:hypothetical protein